MALITGCLLLFLTTTLFSYTGLRFVSAVLFMYKNENWRALIWSVIAVLVHFSLLPLVLLLWIYRSVPLRHLYLLYILGKLNNNNFLYFQIIVVCFMGIVGIFISGNEEYKILLNQELLLFPFKLVINA